MTTSLSPPWPEVRFAPRRLGHVNLWVTDLERSHAFYRDVCGLTLMFDEPGIEARFFGNGNSHHDLAIMQASQREHRGRDGHLQIAGNRGIQAGLNHFAFEMTSEAALVAALSRDRDLGFSVAQTVDHQIARSTYLNDPDHLGLEMYADAEEHFLVTFARVDGELLTEIWDPFAGQPSTAEHFEVDPEHFEVPDAILHPTRTAGAAVRVTDLARSVAFYQSVIGLRLLHEGAGQPGAVLAGQLGLPDLLLLEAGDQPPGLHHITFEVPPYTDLAAAANRLESVGMLVAFTGGSGLVVRDPDGLPVRFAAPPCRDMATVPPDDWSYLI